MKMFEFPENPIYIPKVIDGKISDWQINLPVLYINSYILAWRPSAIRLRQNTEIFIVDPATDGILFPEINSKKNFRKLNYPDVEPEDLYSNISLRRKLIEQSIKNQKVAKADIIIAPYLFAEDTDSTKFVVNLTLLSETIQYFKETDKRLPLFASICIGSSVFARSVIFNHIIDRYSDYFDHVNGFILSVKDFSGRNTTNIDIMLGLAFFIYRLSEYKPVIMKRVDAFGEVLCAIGAAGYSSGLAISETYVKKKKDKNKIRDLKRIYVPEIFDYLNDVEAKKIGYKCHYKTFSNVQHPQTREIKGKHYLFSKIDRMNKMQSLSRGQKIDFLLSEIEKGKILANKWKKDYAIPEKFTHAARWKLVLEKAKNWKSQKQDDEELKRLLAELNND